MAIDIVASFHLTLIGPPELRGPNNQIIHFRTRKHFALLIYLALEAQDHRVPRERLMALLWADVDPDRAKHSLAQGLTTIRNVLGGDAIGRGGAYVKLDANLQTDLDTLDYVADAKTQLPEPLETLDDVGSVDFSHWIDLQRTKISKALRRALTDEVERHRAAGQSGLVRERAVQLYTIDPLNQTAVLALAEADIESGDTTETIPLLEDFLEHARVESGSGGGGGGGGTYPRVERLLTRLKSEPLRPELPKRARSPLPPKRAFIGRHQEIARLEDVWSQVHGPHLETCLLTGRTGIGKTSVAERFTTGIAAGGHVVLSTTCQGGGRDIPYAGLSDLIRCLEQEPELGATDPHWLAQASRIAPWLRVRFPGIPEPDLTTGETARLTIAESFAQLIETVADQCGVLILVDDIHQLDPATREVIYILTRRLHAFPLLVLGVRRTHLDADLEIERPTDDPLHWTSTIEIDRLSDSDARALAIDLTRDRADAQDRSEVIDAVQRLANGHPYFIRLLVEDWLTHHRRSLASMSAHGESDEPWRPPPAIRAAFERHYGHQTPQSRAVGEILAVAGRGLTVVELAGLTGLKHRDVEEAILDGLRSGIFGSDSGRVFFQNELHWAFVYGAESDETRRFLHGKVAMYCNTLQDRGRDPLEIASHLTKSGAADQAHEFAKEGALKALERGAPKEVERVLGAILGESTCFHQDTVLILIEALNLQGKFSQAAKWFEKIQHEPTIHNDVYATALRAEACVRGRIGTPAHIKSLGAQALIAARNTVDHDLSQRLYLVSAEQASDARDFGTLESIQRRPSRLPMPLVDGFCNLSMARHGLAFERFVEAHNDARRRKRPNEQIKALNGAAVCASFVGSLGLAEQYFRQAATEALKVGDHETRSLILNNHAVCLTEFGAFEAALALYDESVYENGLSCTRRYESLLHANRCDLFTIVGQTDEAENEITKARSGASRLMVPRYIFGAYLYQADLKISQGRFAEASLLIAKAERVAQLRAGDATPATASCGESPHFARLIRWRKWLNRETDMPLVSPFDDSIPRRISEFVEIAIFNEWLAHYVGKADGNIIPARRLVDSTGLYGTAARMKRLGLTRENFEKV